MACGRSLACDLLDQPHQRVAAMHLAERPGGGGHAGQCPRIGLDAIDLALQAGHGQVGLGDEERGAGLGREDARWRSGGPPRRPARARGSRAHRSPPARPPCWPPRAPGRRRPRRTPAASGPRSRPRRTGCRLPGPARPRRPSTRPRRRRGSARRRRGGRRDPPCPRQAATNPSTTSLSAAEPSEPPTTSSTKRSAGQAQPGARRGPVAGRVDGQDLPAQRRAGHPGTRADRTRRTPRRRRRPGGRPGGWPARARGRS